MLSLSSLLLSCADLQGSFSLTLPVGNDFLPDIKLLVYAVFSDGEVVADVEQFEVEKCFRHKVSRKHTRNVIASLMCPGLLWFLVLFYPHPNGVSWQNQMPSIFGWETRQVTSFSLNSKSCSPQHQLVSFAQGLNQVPLNSFLAPFSITDLGTYCPSYSP